MEITWCHILTSAHLSAGCLQAGSGAPTSKSLTKAIVFSLVVAHLRSHGVTVSVLKRDLSPRAKAEALDVFQVWAQSLARSVAMHRSPDLTGAQHWQCCHLLLDLIEFQESR